MSRMATKEYIGAKRRAYALADRAKRMRILDEVCGLGAADYMNLWQKSNARTAKGIHANMTSHNHHKKVSILFDELGESERRKCKGKSFSLFSW